MAAAGRRYKRRLILACMSALVAALAGVQVAVYLFGRDSVLAQLGASAKGMAASVSQLVSMAGAGEYAEFLRTRDTGSDYYRKMQGCFASIIEGSGTVRFIYTERRLDGATTEFILDGEPEGSPDHSPPGETDPNNPAKESVFASGAPAVHVSSPGDRWGSLVCGYSPIVGEGGEVLGLVGVDIDGSYVQAQLRRTSEAMAALSAIVACLSLALLLKFSDPIVDRLLKDKPTGAFAKRHFDDLLNYEVRRPARHPKGLALMMLDLDRFKAVNDEYGHAFGDRVLASVSEVIRGSIRSDDAFVRCGGDEFAVIMANAAPDGAADAAERVRRAVEAAPVPPGDGRAPVRVTVSVGVASLAPPPRGAKELAESADRALYRAKETRNSVVVSQ